MSFHVFEREFERDKKLTKPEVVSFGETETSVDLGPE